MTTHDDPASDKPNEEPESPGEPVADGRKVVNFDDLATCGNEVWIRNGGQLYRLQQTRQGKLILTK